VALDKFIDDFSALAVERCLMQRLPTPSSFNQDKIYDYPPEKIIKLTNEKPETIAARIKLQEEFAILDKGLQELDVFDKQETIFSGIVLVPKYPTI
jgi:hypothetical protein